MIYSRDNRQRPQALQCSCNARAAASRSRSAAVGNTVMPSKFVGVGLPMNLRSGPTKLLLHHLAPCAFRRAISTPSIITVPAVNDGFTAWLVAICAHLMQLGREAVTEMSKTNVGSTTDVDTKNAAKPQLFHGHADEHRGHGYAIVNP